MTVRQNVIIVLLSPCKSNAVLGGLLKTALLFLKFWSFAMTNNFSLVSNTTGERVDLREVDDDIWQLFGQEPNPDKWCLGWYTVIGTLVAVRGINLHDSAMDEKLLDWYTDDLHRPEDDLVYDRMCQVLTFLRERYTSESWVTIGR
jgi:hypothetical protein